MSYDWAPERVEKLKELWKEGLSASQMVGRLGGSPGPTRNSVIGKLHRIGLSGNRQSEPGKLRTKKPKQAAHVSKAQTRATRIKQILAGCTPLGIQSALETVERAAPVAKYVPVGRVSFENLEDGACKFPVGEQAPYLFCGSPQVPGLPYCEHCARASYAVAKAPTQSGPSRNNAIINYVRKISAFA